MAGIILQSPQDVEDLTWGAAFYGIGGGGSPWAGMDALKAQLERGGPINCIDPELFPDEAFVATHCFMGHDTPPTEEERKLMRDMGLDAPRCEDPLYEAMQLLERITGKSFSGMVCAELGGGNTSGPLASAARLGYTVFDGDYCGKAVPQMVQAGPVLNGFPHCPVASVDCWGNQAALLEACNVGMNERIGKMLAVAAFGQTAIAMFPLSGAEMKKIIIPGTISASHAVGKAIREAGERGADPLRAIAETSGAELLFRGRLIHVDAKAVDGYYQGYRTIEGTGAFSGKMFKIWFKNENHMSWLDGEVRLTTPDLLCQVDAHTGIPVPNNNMETGQEIAFFGLPAHERHTHAEGMSPQYYGFDVAYRPFKNR